MTDVFLGSCTTFASLVIKINLFFFSFFFSPDFELHSGKLPAVTFFRSSMIT